MFIRLKLSLPLAALCLLIDSGAALPQEMSAEEIVEEYKRAVDFAGQGKCAEAAAVYERMLPNAERLFGKNSVNTAAVLSNLASQYVAIEDFAKAEPLFLRSLRISEARKDKEGNALENTLLNLGDMYVLTGQYAKAEPLLLRSQQIVEAKLGTNHTDVALRLGVLSRLYLNLGEYAKVRPLVERTLEIRERNFGKDQPYVAQSVDNLGVLCQAEGDYAAARTHMERALRIRQKSLGMQHAETAQSHRNLGALLRIQGEYAEARANLEQGLQIYEKALGKQNSHTADTLNSLGALFSEQGDTVAARSHFEQALTIFKKVLGDDHPNTANTLSNLGILLQSQGDDAGARLYLEKALALRKRNLGEHHVYVAQSLYDLGALFAGKQDYAKARACYEQSLAIRKKALGEKHPKTIDTLEILANALTAQGYYAEARRYYDQAIAVHKEVFGTSHFTIARAQYNLGCWHYSGGDELEAASHFDQALAIDAKVLGDKHPATGMSRYNLGLMLALRGEFAKARPYFEQGAANTRASLDLAAAAQAERQQLVMGNLLRHHIDTFVSLPCDTPAQTAAVYEQVLAWKGSIFARQHQFRVEKQNPKLATSLKELRSVSGRLANLAFATPDPKNRDAWLRQLERLTHDKETLERDLAQKSTAIRHEEQLHNMKVEELVLLLPADAVLVDFVVYDRQLEKDKDGRRISYECLTAFILQHGKPVVRVDLGRMQPIEAAIDRWRGRTKITDEKQAAQQLRRDLWSPLEKHLAGTKLLLISPDGALGRFPFAALPGSKQGSYLLEEVPMAIVPVPRFLPALLTERKDEKGKEPSLLLVGDVDFDAEPGNRIMQERLAAAGERHGTRQQWRRLPGTRVEIEKIRDSFVKRFATANARILRGDQATQANLRELAGRYSHLHLATHGFFAPESVRSALAASEKDRARGGLFDRDGVVGFHPGLLSGLVLAGANRPSASGAASGIVTALDVAALDLAGVEMAVLSACETGLGKTAGGEGMLGLQRAFQIAGARTTVTSLWSVPDKATQVLMDRFYANLWDKSRPRSKLEALREAQIWMLREGRAHPEVLRGAVLEDLPAQTTGRMPPYYWAAFILSGDWQ